MNDEYNLIKHVAKHSVSETLGKSLPANSRSFHDRATCRRHAAERYCVLGWRGGGRLSRNQLSLLDPVIKFVAAAVTYGGQRLLLAFGAFRGAGKADMKMMVVVPP